MKLHTLGKIKDIPEGDYCIVNNTLYQKEGKTLHYVSVPARIGAVIRSHEYDNSRAKLGKLIEVELEALDNG